MTPEQKKATFRKRGLERLEKKDYPRAILEFRNAAAQAPKDPEPYYQIGLASLAEGDVSGALTALAKANELNPEDAKPQVKLAEILTGSGRRDFIASARNRLQTLLKSSPDDPEIRSDLADAELLLGDAEDASQNLEQALQKSPAYLRASTQLALLKLKRKDLTGAEEIFRKAAEAAPASSEAAAALGQFYLITRDPAKAEAQFKKAIQLDPQNASARMSLGAIEIASNRLAEADQTYKEVSNLGIPKYRPIHAIFLYQTGKLDAALEEFEKQAKSDPNDRAARLRLFQTYITIKKYTEADRLVADAVKRNPRDTDILLLKSERDLQRGQASAAEESLNQVLKIKPDSVVAHYRMARAKALQGQKAAEEHELAEALRLAPGMLPARLTLARTYLAHNNAKAALAVVDEAPRAHAVLRDTIVERNWALFALGRHQELRQSLDEALKNGRDGTFLLQDALLRVSQRDNDGARTTINELLKQEPTNFRAAYLLVQTYFEQKQLPEGLKRLQEIADANPKAFGIQEVLGQWYMRAGDTRNARKAFEAAKAGNPRYLSPELALAELDAADNHLDSAHQRLAEVLRLEPENVGALMRLAAVEERLNNRHEAIQRYQAVLTRDSSNIIALNNMAYDMALENPDDALKPAEQAVQLAPSSAVAQDTLGFVYYRKGLYSVALQHLKTAASLDTAPLYQFHLGLCYSKVGENGTGQAKIAAALAKDPSLSKTQAGWLTRF